MLEFIGFPFITWESGEDEERISWFERMDVIACLAVGVAFDDQVDEGWFVEGAGGRVGSDYWTPLAVLSRKLVNFP